MISEWLSGVFTQGESHLLAPPMLEPQSREKAFAVLRSAFERVSLDIGGPAIAFDPEAALEAALVLATACWRLVSSGGEDQPLALSREPATPSAHLSVDLSLRFLPSVHRRARLRGEDDPLRGKIETLLRRWPLSGVLVYLDGEPATDLSFDRHPGLQMLYAERQVVHGRPGWLPTDARAREWIDRVYQERGKSLPVHEGAIS